MSGVGLLMVTPGLPTNLGTVTITKGTTGLPGNRFIGFQSGSFGAVSPATDPIYHATINGIYWDENAQQFILQLAGTQANSGWTSFTLLGGPTFNRASATYSTAGGTSWTWAAASNPFAGLSSPITGYWQ